MATDFPTNGIFVDSGWKDSSGAPLALEPDYAFRYSLPVWRATGGSLTAGRTFYWSFCDTVPCEVHFTTSSDTDTVAPSRPVVTKVKTSFDRTGNGMDALELAIDTTDDCAPAGLLTLLAFVAEDEEGARTTQTVDAILDFGCNGPYRCPDANPPLVSMLRPRGVPFPGTR